MRSANNDRGYALVAFLILMALGVMIATGAINVSSTSARSAYAGKVRTERFYDAETVMSDVLGWMRANSQSLVTPFTQARFYTDFDRTSPTVGSNDESPFNVPSRLKIAGTNDSAMLVSHNDLGDEHFPSTQHVITNAAFDAESSFASTFANDRVRLTLVDALALDPSKDWGAPPNPGPQSDFYPIYRIDAMTDIDEGSHVFGYVLGSLSYVDTVGFYGRDFLEARQACDSYNSADGAYGGGNRRAHCPVGSNGEIRVHQNTTIYGSLRTNGDILESAPWGGDVCATFAIGCPDAGATCEGAGCGVPGLPTFQPWNGYCPSDQGDRIVNANTTWNLGGGAPNQTCWNNVTVNSNRTLTLTSTQYPYFINTLTLSNNSNSRLRIAPNPPTGTVRVYVQNITGDALNGNQLVNTNNRPSQLRMYYLGNNALTLNGTADMNAAIVSPNAGVNVSGNFLFQGGILATNLTMTGSGTVHYDESLGGTWLNDMTFRLRGEVQYYR